MCLCGEVVNHSCTTWWCVVGGCLFVLGLLTQRGGVVGWLWQRPTDPMCAHKLCLGEREGHKHTMRGKKKITLLLVTEEALCLWLCVVSHERGPGAR